MHVGLVNDGPVTIELDSKVREPGASFLSCCWVLIVCSCAVKGELSLGNPVFLRRSVNTLDFAVMDVRAVWVMLVLSLFQLHQSSFAFLRVDSAADETPRSSSPETTDAELHVLLNQSPNALNVVINKVILGSLSGPSRSHPHIHDSSRVSW